MNDLPTGTPTFLFSDIEGSTRLLQELGDEYSSVLDQHRRLMREAFTANEGHELGTEGDSFFVTFERASDAVHAAVAAQRALRQLGKIRVRIGVHTGEAKLVGSDYVGLAVHQAARISAAAHGGQVLVSQATKDLASDATHIDWRDLGEHGLKDLARPVRIYQVCHSDLDIDFPPIRSLDARETNLPPQLTAFIGRGRELEELTGLVASNRLVTLTGAGGSGKTRLAIELGHTVVDAYPDGVWFVDLAPVLESDLVSQTVAAAVGLREQQHRSIEASLEEFFASKKVLLILDNCEHLVASCADLAERLLKISTDLTILVTTREALGIDGEIAWRVPSLDVPDPRGLPPADEIASFEAVRLFIERATAVEPTFAPSNDDLVAIVNICHRLDGIPLAIELAAARVAVLAPKQIVERLDDRFRLLTGGRRTALARQQTLRALVDWSYDLLDEDERKLLQRVSVFVGGFTIEAAEAVCADDLLDSYDVLDVLARLVDKSLVVADRSADEARYRLLETIRQYAREKLLEQPEAAEVRTRHRDFFLQLAERAEPELRGASQKQWLDRLEIEHENLRTAIEWSLAEPTKTDDAFRLIWALWRFWWIRGYWSENRSWVARATESAPASALHSRALWSAGFAASFQGELSYSDQLIRQSLEIADAFGDSWTRGYGAWTLSWNANTRGEMEDARRWYDEALTIARTMGDKCLEAWSYFGLANVEAQGDMAVARELQQRALELSRETGDPWNLAMALKNVGLLDFLGGDTDGLRRAEESLAYWRELGDTFGLAQTLDQVGFMATSIGDHETARPYLEESLRIWRSVGRTISAAMTLNALAWMAHLRGDDEEAISFADDAVAIFRTTENKHHLGNTLHTLGEAHRGEGNLEAAGNHLGEALEVAVEVQDDALAVSCLRSLAGLAVAGGDATRAAQLFGAAEALREKQKGPVDDSDSQTYERDLEKLRSTLEADKLDPAWEQGRQAPLEESISFALEEVQ